MNFLGTTLFFPIRSDVRGSLAVASTDDEIIRQAIVDLLETRQGERKMLPNYGLPDFIFDAIDVTFAPRVAFYIEEQIRNYITSIENVSASAGTFDNGIFTPNALASTHKAVIRVGWTKRNQFVPQELIFPTWRILSL